MLSAARSDNARRAIAEAKRIDPFWTIRYFSPEDLTSEVRVAQVKRYQEGLRMAGARDHADEDADFGVSPDGELRANLDGYTATHCARRENDPNDRADAHARGAEADHLGFLGYSGGDPYPAQSRCRTRESEAASPTGHRIA